MRIEISISDSGVVSAVVEPPYEVLGWYLTDDIQASLSSCEHVLRRCDEVARTGEPWEGTGNAHTVTVRREGVLIENLFADEDRTTAELSLEEFRTALRQWRAAIVK